MAMSNMRRSRRLFSVSRVLLLLALCCLSRFAAAASQKKASATSALEKKLNNLATRGPVVPLTASNFTRYADGSRTGRPYHVVLLFTSSNPEHKCSVCRAAEENFGKVARAYALQQELGPQDGHVLGDGNLIVFAVVDAAKSLNTFMTYHISSAPHAFVIPLGQNLPHGPEKEEMEVTRSLTGGRADARSTGFASDVSRATGLQILILPDTSGLISVAVALGVVLGLIGFVFSQVPARIMATVRYTGVWVTASTACYMTGVGGMIYCIIRNPHLHGFDQKSGVAAMFSAGGRDQFWYEGLVIAVMNVAMAFAIFAAYRAAGWKRVPSILRGMAVLICITALCYTGREYLKMYTKKTPWYSLQQMLPKAVASFHTEKLKRGHGLLRRLVRLSQIWLNEFTTMQAFGERAKSLLWDFLVRTVKSWTGL